MSQPQSVKNIDFKLNKLKKGVAKEILLSRKHVKSTDRSLNKPGGDKSAYGDTRIAAKLSQRLSNRYSRHGRKADRSNSRKAKAAAKQNRSVLKAKVDYSMTEGVTSILPAIKAVSSPNNDGESKGLSKSNSRINDLRKSDSKF